MGVDTDSDQPAEIARLALERPDDQRAAFLDEACGGDPELRARVAQLVAEADETRLALPDELPTQTLQPKTDPYQLTGATIAQYRIGERLGEGGMGVVYKAHDTRLDRTVALKFLRLSLTEEATARDRFVAEARSASALDHANICTVHEFGERADGSVFIVMSYYPGQTLAERITAGALPTEVALDYARQIASGLAAAHARGILHRDLKPANIMVTAPQATAEHGVLKILDFGLAKMEGIELTRTGTTMGTLAYMSPEQARGERVDPRADIWSLGVILYEMLTGRRPFAAKSELAILQALANEEIEPPRQIDASIPEELQRVVLKCLAKERKSRYADTSGLLADLRSLYLATVSGTLSGGLGDGFAKAPPRRWRSPLGKLPWRSPLVLAAIGVLLIVLVVAVPIGRRLGLAPSTVAPARGSLLLAVLPFVNTLEGTPENQALTDGLSYSLTALVSRLGSNDESLWIVPASEVFQQGITSAGEALKYFGVNRVLTGSVQRTGLEVELVLNLIDPTSQPPRTLDSRVLTAPLSPAQRDQAMGQLAGLLGIEWSLVPGTGDTAADTTSAAAYTLYLQGMGYLQRRDRSGGFEDAERAFRQALELDPEFGAAHAGLCEALWEVYRVQEQAALAREAMASCARAGELSGDQAAVLVSVGRSYLEMGEGRRARAEFAKALALEPHNAEAHRWLGWVDLEAGRPEQAVASFRRAIAAEPGLWLYPNDFGELLIMLGRPEEAAEQFERARDLTPENYVAVAMLGVARSMLGEDRAAAELYERSLALEPNSLAYRNLGYLRFREGRYEEAVDSLRRATELAGVTPYSNDWVILSYLAHAYYWAGDRAAAEQTWRRLIEVATARYEVNPKDLYVLALLSESYAALGEPDSARLYLSRLLAMPLESNHIHFIVARTYELLGDREFALSYLARALEERYDPWMVDSDPWLTDLRNEPDYLDLKQRYVPPGE